MKMTNLIINLLNKMKNKFTSYRRRKYWRKEFKKNTDKKRNLSKEQKNEIKNYYSKYFKISTIFHEFYYQKTGNYSKYYIPDDFYYTKIDPFFNNWNEAFYIDNKCNYDKLFPNVFQPKTIIKRMNELYYNDNNMIIDKIDALRIIKNKKNFFLKKATDSEGGHGVYYIQEYDNFKDIIDNIKTDFIVQEQLIQCDELNKIHPNSINTIRIISLIHNNKVNILSTILRMGVNGSKIDNASSGGITCGIDKNGFLKEIAYAADGKSYSKHPTTNVRFNSVLIPNYNQIIKLVKTLAITIPHFRLVSWDIAVDKEKNPVLIEANLRYGEIDFHQLNNGPLFGDSTDEILNEVFKARGDK